MSNKIENFEKFPEFPICNLRLATQSFMLGLMLKIVTPLVFYFFAPITTVLMISAIILATHENSILKSLSEAFAPIIEWSQKNFTVFPVSFVILLLPLKITIFIFLSTIATIGIIKLLIRMENTIRIKKLERENINSIIIVLAIIIEVFLLIPFLSFAISILSSSVTYLLLFVFSILKYLLWSFWYFICQILIAAKFMLVLATGASAILSIGWMFVEKFNIDSVTLSLCICFLFCLIIIHSFPLFFVALVIFVTGFVTLGSEYLKALVSAAKQELQAWNSAKPGIKQNLQIPTNSSKISVPQKVVSVPNVSKVQHMQQIRNDSNFSNHSPVIRQLLELSRSETSSFHLYQVLQGMQYFNEISGLFQPLIDTKNCTQFNAWMIFNETLMQAYELRLEQVKKDLKDYRRIEAEKKWVFHGTDGNYLRSIFSSGWDRGFSGVNGTVHGRGTYFATNITYSYDYSKLENTTGKRYMIVARIAAGEYCKSEQKLTVLPHIPNKLYRYHSAVDNVTNPTIYVIFHDSGALPVYLIEFW